MAHLTGLVGPFDVQSYIRDIQTRPCFIYEMVARNPAYAPEIVYEDDVAIAFLNKYPPFYGYVLVAPLPFGVPFEEQQLEALHMKDGVLQLSTDELTALTRQLREAM